MYRSSLQDVPVPKWADVRQFMSKAARERSRLESTFPALALWRRWYEQTVQRDETLFLASGEQSGAIKAIEKLLDWTPGAELDFGSAGAVGRARSSRSTGCLVDDELSALLADDDETDEYLHRYTKWVATNLTQRGWLPLACQVPLWSEHVRTWADMIAFDLKRARFVLIELKTGYDHNYRVVREPFAPERHILERTHYNEHQMQLGWMHFVMHETGHPQPLDSYVLRVSSKNGVAVPMPLDHDIVAVYQCLWRKSGGFPPMLADAPPPPPPVQTSSSSSSTDNGVLVVAPPPVDNDERVGSKRARTDEDMDDKKEEDKEGEEHKEQEDEDEDEDKKEEEKDARSDSKRRRRELADEADASSHDDSVIELSDSEE
jgi:hypothetical protein